MLRNRLAGTRFQLGDVSACCKVSVGTRCRGGGEWLDRVCNCT